MEYLLHIDTSAGTGTIAINKEGEIIASRATADAKNFAAVINVLINECLYEAGINLQQINGFVVCGGPGSYTGLRIGLSTAKAFCYVLKKPLILDNKLTLLAYQQYQKYMGEYELYASILKARDQEYFITIYNNLFDCITAPKHTIESELSHFFFPFNKILLTGDVPEFVYNNVAYKELNVINNSNIIIETWATYAWEEYKCNRIVNFASAVPFYLKQVYTHK